MAGFFPHTGIINGGYTALAPSSYTNILSDIVTDIGAGVNGWTVFDDQRAPGGGATSIYVAHQRGFASGGYTSATFTFTNASATVVGYMMPTFREVIVGTTQISLDQTNWYTISALVAPSSNNYN